MDDGVEKSILEWMEVDRMIDLNAMVMEWGIKTITSLLTLRREVS